MCLQHKAKLKERKLQSNYSVPLVPSSTHFYMYCGPSEIGLIASLSSGPYKHLFEFYKIDRIRIGSLQPRIGSRQISLCR